MEVRALGTSREFRGSYGVRLHGYWQSFRHQRHPGEESLTLVILASSGIPITVTQPPSICTAPFLFLLTNFSTPLSIPFDFSLPWFLLVHNCLLTFSNNANLQLIRNLSVPCQISRRWSLLDLMISLFAQTFYAKPSYRPQTHLKIVWGLTRRWENWGVRNQAGVGSVVWYRTCLPFQQESQVLWLP